jgi:hypothetical protein
MRLSSVVLARVIARVELFDLDPKGAVYFPNIAQALVQRFKFQKFPQKYEDFDPHEGIVFARGLIEGLAIHGLTLSTHSITLDTRSSTNDSEEVMHEILVWGGSNLGLKYNPAMIKRKCYTSQLTFFSELPMLPSMSPALAKLSDRLTASLRESLPIDEEAPEYDLGSVLLQHDQLKRKHPLIGFTISRAIETPYKENKYYSEAPCSTHLHENLLRGFEADLIAAKRKIIPYLDSAACRVTPLGD